MKEKKEITIIAKVLRRITAVMLAVALSVSGINLNPIPNTVNGEQVKADSIKSEINITEQQKEEAKKEDEKLKKKLKETKESKEKNKKATVVKELKKLRTSNSTTYLLSDGSRKLEIYGEDVRYKENGQYLDYDPSIKKISKSEKKELRNQKGVADKYAKGKYAYVNTAGDAKHYFPEELDENNAVVLTKKNHVISFTPVITDIAMPEEQEDNEKINLNDEESVNSDTAEENNKESEKGNVSSLHIKKDGVKENSITYAKNKEQYYKYTSLTNGVKEEIILEEKPDDNIFEFRLNLPGMKLESIEGSEELRIIDKNTHKMVAYISEPNIQDARGKVSYDAIHYETEKENDGEYLLKVVVDETYLGSQNTKYPVTIDPTATWTNDRLETASVSDFPYTLNTNRKHGSIFNIHNRGIKYTPYLESEDACYIDTSGIDTGTVFAGTTDMFYGSDIKSAALRITERGNTYQIGPNAFDTFTSGTIEVRTPVSTWSPDTITWNNHPPMGDRVWSQFTSTGVENDVHNIDLKDWAQAVANRSIENTGLALKCVEEGTGAAFYGASFQNAPHYMMLSITYENPHIGEKDIYSYEDYATSNGTGKIELSQGNFLYKQEDFALPTPQLGLEINRIYNSRNTEQTDFGIGWTCEYNARIATYNESSLTYIDGTGSIYGFRSQLTSDGTEWVCSENPDLSLEIEESTQKRVLSETDTAPSSTVSFTSQYIITDKDKVKKYFDKDGKLRLIEEANGTFLYIKYHPTYALIQSVYSSNGQKMDFEYSYAGGDYFISKTTLADGSSFHYTYENKKLTEVTHKGSDGNEISYHYTYNENGQMNKIVDAMGETYRLEYDGKSIASAIYPNNERIDVYTNQL